MDVIFEVRDTTDDENYYPLGLFESLDEVKKIIADHNESGEAITEYGSDCGTEDHESITVVERKIGWHSDNYKTVIQLEREQYYDEENDVYKWRESSKT